MKSSSSSESPPKHTGPDLITFLPFLPDSTWMFPIALVVEESFCQSPDVFLVCFWREVNSTVLLLHYLDLSSVNFIFFRAVLGSEKN